MDRYHQWQHFAAGNTFGDSDIYDLFLKWAGFVEEHGRLTAADLTAKEMQPT